MKNYCFECIDSRILCEKKFAVTRQSIVGLKIIENIFHVQPVYWLIFLFVKHFIMLWCVYFGVVKKKFDSIKLIVEGISNACACIGIISFKRLSELRLFQMAKIVDSIIMKMERKNHFVFIDNSKYLFLSSSNVSAYKKYVRQHSIWS